MGGNVPTNQKTDLLRPIVLMQPALYSACRPHYRLVQFKADNISVLLKARPQVCPVIDEPHGNRGYYVPQASDLGLMLQKMLRGNEYFGMSIDFIDF